MDTQIKQLNDRIIFLEEFIKSLQADTTIPLEVDRALISRLQVAQGSSNNKTAASGTVSIPPAGGSAMKPPDGFITITINGTPKNIPFIT